MDFPDIVDVDEETAMDDTKNTQTSGIDLADRRIIPATFLKRITAACPSFFLQHEEFANCLQEVADSRQGFEDSEALTAASYSWVEVVSTTLNDLANMKLSLDSLESEINALKATIIQKSHVSNTSEKPAERNALERFTEVEKGFEAIRGRLTVFSSILSLRNRSSSLFEQLVEPEMKVIKMLASLTSDAEDGVKKMEGKVAASKATFSSIDDRLKDFVITNIDQTASRDTYLSQVFDVISTSDGKDLLKQREQSYQTQVGAAEEVSAAQAFSEFAGKLRQFIKLAVEIARSVSKDRVDSNDRLLDDVAKLFITTIETSFSSLGQSVLLFLRFEQVRLRELHSKLKDRKEEEEQHVFLYSDTELHDELVEIRKKIHDLSRVIRKSEMKLDSISELSLSLVCAILNTSEGFVTDLYGDADIPDQDRSQMRAKLCVEVEQNDLHELVGLVYTTFFPGMVVSF